MSGPADGIEAANGRVLGRLTGAPGAGTSGAGTADAARGPLLLVTVGIHGNEPSGVTAARRVLARLHDERTPLHGELLILLGNRGALEQGRRFVQRDLNRGWTDDGLDRLRALRASRAEPQAEDREQLELLAAIDAAIAGGRRVFALDLHTTSADGFAFSIVAGSAGSSEFALEVGLPAVRGILERVDGILAEYLGRRGCLAMAVEGGQNEDARSVERLESVLTVALAWTGLVERSRLPDLPQHKQRLREDSAGLPRVIDIHHRHALRSDDGFRMEPGFANLQRIRAGTLLAHDRSGEFRAREDGWLVFPLYQSQGDDGFFLGRESET